MYSGRKNNMVHPAEDDNYFFGDTYDYDYPRDTRLQVGSPNISLTRNGSSRSGMSAAYGSRQSFWSDEIQALTTCDQLYLYQANKFSPDIASNYDVRNGEGKLIFKAVESIDPVVKDLHEIHDQKKPPFVLSIIDMKTGKEVMKINGNLARGVMMVYAKQYSADMIIGLVRRIDEKCGICCPPTFSLERPNGAVLLRVRSSMKSLLSCCCLCTCRLTSQFNTRFFNVYLNDDITYIGEIKHLRKKFDEEYGDPEANKTKAVLAAVIPEDSTSSNKALLLASMFMLDFIYFQKNRRSLKCPKISKTCTIIIVIVVVVAIIGLMAVLFGGGGYSGQRTNKGKTPKG